MIRRVTFNAERPLQAQLWEQALLLAQQLGSPADQAYDGLVFSNPSGPPKRAGPRPPLPSLR
jgi:hypothetical protein